MIKLNYQGVGHDVQMVMDIDNGGETWVEAVDFFQRFLKASGYHFHDDFDMADILAAEHDRLMEEKYGTSFRRYED